MLAGAFAGRAFAEPAAFFASDPMLSTAWGQVTYPAAIYVSSTNTTYACWQFVGQTSGYKGVHVAGYNHTTNTWGERYSAGNFFLSGDDHGDAVLIRDASGYIHCFYGSHANGQKWSVTNSVDDISAWTQQADFGTAVTYPVPVLVGSTIYLFLRNDASLTNRKLAYATMTPTAGVGTFSALTNIVDFGASSRVYRAECHAVGTNIHFVCAYTTDTDLSRKHVYHFVLDTTTGSISNSTGSTTVTSGSLPVTLTQANTSFRIYDHGSNDGDLASFQFDTSGNAHVLFADGAEPTYSLKHMIFTGGAWSSPTTVSTTISDGAIGGGYVDNYTLVPGANGKMEAWYNVAGDKVRRIRNADGTWRPAETIKVAGSLDLVHGAAVRDAHRAFRVMFAENSGTLSDASAANLSLYAYGAAGPVNDAIPMAAVDPAGFSNVVLLLSGNHRNNATSLIDESKLSLRVTPSGNAKVDTGQSPFAGRGSIRLDGTGDYYTVMDSSAFSVSGTSDFCIDGWVRLSANNRLQTICAKRPASGSSEFAFYIGASNQLQMLMLNGATVLNLTGTTALSTGTWYYVEVSRISSVTYLFLGTAGGTTTLEASGTQSAAPTTNSQAFLIGRDPSNTSRDLNGWLADFRFTRAGRHSSTFTVPSTPFPRR